MTHRTQRTICRMAYLSLALKRINLAHPKVPTSQNPCCPRFSTDQDKSLCAWGTLTVSGQYHPFFSAALVIRVLTGSFHFASQCIFRPFCQATLFVLLVLKPSFVLVSQQCRCHLTISLNLSAQILLISPRLLSAISVP